MTKRKYIYIIILVTLVLVYIGSPLFRPRPFDWTLSFQMNSKAPFGCYVLHEKLKDLISVPGITGNNVDLYRGLARKSLNNSSVLIITDAFKPDKADLRSLLDYVKKGNNAFISAQDFDGLLGDTLKLKSTDEVYEWTTFGSNLKLILQNTNLQEPRSFSYKQIASFYFSSVDSGNTTIIEKDSLGHATFVKTRFGEGYFFLHANPLVFTNYHILYNSFAYPSRSLAYLAGRPVIWDEYYKPGRVKGPGKSPLRYLLSQESFRYAYVLFIITWLLFVLFIGKRKQRIIPEYSKPVNQSLGFIETVGQLYYNQRNNQDIVHKKITYFADYVHSAYYLKFQPEDSNFRKDFAQKANLSLSSVNAFFDILIQLQHAESVSDSQLMSFITEMDQIQYQSKSLIQK